MAIAAIFVLALFARKRLEGANVSPIPSERNSGPCTSFTVPVPITALNHVYDIVLVHSNVDAVHFARDLDIWEDPSFADRIIQNITISKTYDIHMQLCAPPTGSKKSSLQLATHGGGFDSRYCDPEVEPEQHSYVHAALDAGYSVLTYDRLGNGTFEVEILRGISEVVRNGSLSRYGSYNNATIAFEKIIHVDHSYGSFVTYALTALYPNLSDAAILTGFIYDKEIFAGRSTAMALEYAPENDPLMFANSTPGYVIQST